MLLRSVAGKETWNGGRWRIWDEGGLKQQGVLEHVSDMMKTRRRGQCGVLGDKGYSQKEKAWVGKGTVSSHKRSLDKSLGS